MDRSSWRVLIVEDDTEIRQLMVMFIRSLWRCQIVEARDGVEAIAIATEKPFNVIFLDLVMPSISGIQVLHTLKADARSSKTPIIVVSDHCWDRSVEMRSLEAGALACLDKGGLFDAFYEKVEKLLENEQN